MTLLRRLSLTAVGTIAAFVIVPVVSVAVERQLPCKIDAGDTWYSRALTIFIPAVYACGGGTGSGGTAPPPDCKADAIAVRQSPLTTTTFRTSCASNQPQTEAREEFDQLSVSDRCQMLALKKNDCNGGTHLVSVDKRIPKALAFLADTSQCRYDITAFGGGIHSATSNHYQGRAIDIDNPGCSEATLINVFCTQHGLHVCRETTHYHISTQFPDCPASGTQLC